MVKSLARWCLLLTALAACGDDPSVTVIMEVTSESPPYGSAPFPTDAIRDGDRLGLVTGLDKLVGQYDDHVARQLAALDGFGVRPVVELFVDGALDPASIPAATSALADAALLVDVDPSSPARGSVLPMDWKYDVDRNVIAGAPHPGTVLREGTRYAALVTTDILAADGRPLSPSGGLGKLASAGDRWATTAEAYAGLVALPELKGRIAGLTAFTTQRATAPLVAAREAIAAAPAPVLAFDDAAIVFDTAAKLDAVLGRATRDTDGPRAGLERWGGDNPTGIAHDHVGVLATGTMTIARFRGDDTATDGPEDETFQLDAAGVPRILAIEPIPVTFVLPKGPIPASGFPVVIFGHGLGGSRHDILNLVEPLTSRGFAVVGIDTWGHGSRYGAPDNRNNYFDREAFTGDRMLRDGFGDDPGTAAYLDFFEGFLNIAAIRDAIRQTVLDQARLATLIQDPALDLSTLNAAYAGVTPKLDRARVAYLGQSFGTIVGASLAALEPSVELYVLNVPGGGLLDQIFTSSAYVGSLAIPLVDLLYRPRTKLDRFDPLLSMLQAVFDGGDPLSFAPHVLRDRFTIAGAPLSPRHVVGIEVIGDEIMSNAGTIALARALGLSVVTPALEPAGLPELASPASGNVDGQTGLLVQYSPASHGFNWSHARGDLTFVPGFPHPEADPYPRLPAPIEIAEPLYETHEQVAEILATYRAGMAPVVRITKPPVRDFDADGRLDDVDPAPHDPSR